MYPNAYLEATQRQASDLVAKIGQLQQYQYQAPSVAPLPQPPQIPPHIDYVKGIDGAREFLNKMPANGNAVVMDQEEATFYVLSKDANGVPAPIAFANFTLQMEQPPEQQSYVTAKDFEAFRDEMRALLAQKGETA